MAMETIFTDYERACVPVCDDVTKCSRCAHRLSVVSYMLARSDARVWEVWAETASGLDVVGILYLTRIVPGVDAVAHYAFFDGKVRSRTSIMEAAISWLFSPNPSWSVLPLQRVSLEIPDYAFALAHHATKHLGFGGPFRWKHTNGKSIPVEGVKPNYIRWRGSARNLLLLGRLAPNG